MNDITLSLVDISKVDISTFEQQFVDCVILTQDGQILLQYRPTNWHTSPDKLTILGGHLEKDEPVFEGLKRELAEELGAVVDEVRLVETLSEEISGVKSLIHIYFWHDRRGTIQGCYEGEARFYKSVDEALSQPNLMPHTSWALKESKARGFFS